MNLPAVQCVDAEVQARASRVLLGWLSESCPSEASRLVYKNDLEHFGSYLQGLGKDVFNIDKQDVQLYLEFLRMQNLSAATRAKKLTVIKGLLRSLSTDGLFLVVDLFRQKIVFS